MFYQGSIKSLTKASSSHRKNLFAARCEYLHLIKKNSQQANEHCEFFLIRCKHSQRAMNQFLRWLEKRLKAWVKRRTSYKPNSIVQMNLNFPNLHSGLLQKQCFIITQPVAAKKISSNLTENSLLH